MLRGYVGFTGNNDYERFFKTISFIFQNLLFYALKVPVLNDKTGTLATHCKPTRYKRTRPTFIKTVGSINLSHINFKVKKGRKGLKSFTVYLKMSNFAPVLAKRLKFRIMVIRQLAILFGCLALGELIIHLTHVPLPSSILGMLLLTLMLRLKVIRLEWVQGLSEFLVANIGFFFVPTGVAVMLYFDIIRAQLVPIVVASAVSTVLVLAVTGWVHQFYGKAVHRKEDKQ